MIAPLALAALLLQAPAPSAPAPQPPPLAETDALRVETHALRLRVAQLETQLRTMELTREREMIDAALRAAYPGWHMDWTTGALVPDAAEEPEG